MIGATARLRVHWMVPVQPSTITDVYTGNTVFHFLYGFGAEELGSAANERDRGPRGPH